MFTFTDILAGENIKMYGNTTAKALTKGQLGLLLKIPKENEEAQYCIVYDDTRSMEVCRTTAMHELGHYFLGHLDMKKSTNGEDEFMAEVFATVMRALQVYEKYRGDNKAES